jgi:hypothetical protein
LNLSSHKVTGETPIRRPFVPELEITKFLRTKLAVVDLHFQMCAAAQLAPANGVDLEALEAFATQGIIQYLQSDELFMPAQHMRDKYYHAPRVLHVEHRPVVPYSMIVKVFGVAKATMYSQPK